ncbi:hypothetical protein SDC9_175029 [bioreactor metagenome]|uniref:Uncharacterized protein n=1 Tax=bioreactor metagenome TaxID=1076179 RepID=A0A645GLJ8_9ZZZZ
MPSVRVRIVEHAREKIAVEPGQFARIVAVGKARELNDEPRGRLLEIGAVCRHGTRRFIDRIARIATAFDELDRDRRHVLVCGAHDRPGVCFGHGLTSRNLCVCEGLAVDDACRAGVGGLIAACAQQHGGYEYKSQVF